MIEEGVLDGVQEIYGIHNASMFPLGDIKSAPGAMMAGAVMFNITVNGKGGHGSFPERVNDCITALC